jgi:flagellar basal-body rod modification protein FlgD
MSTNGVANASSTSTASSSTASGFSALKPEDFVKMLIAELQHQDPTKPMDSSQILQEVSQIDNIATNQTLTQTLHSVLLGQSLASASGLLQMPVTALDASGNPISGTVDSVSIANGEATLNIGGKTAKLSDVTEILPYGTTTTSNQGG